MTCDKFHLILKFLYFSGKVNSSYDLNDGRRGCCHQVCPLTDMKLCRKLYHPKKQLCYLNVNRISSSIYKQKEYVLE